MVYRRGTAQFLPLICILTARLPHDQSTKRYCVRVSKEYRLENIEKAVLNFLLNLPTIE